MVFVGVLLMSGVALVGMEAVGYARGGYNSAFWKLPLDDKLDRIGEHRWEWWWISVWSLVGLFLMTGGLVGLTFMLAGEGESVLASVALGGYLVALIAWIFGAVTQAAAMPAASKQKAETGRAPSWIHPLWDAGFLAESIWVFGTNLAYIVMGMAVVQSGFPAAWSGWAAIGLAAFIVVVVAATRVGFPQLGLLAPFVLGVAMIIEAL